MPTEREVLQQIMNDDPDGIPALFDRHAALFCEGLIRFFGAAGSAQADILLEMARNMREDLKAGQFEDLEETFYDWVVRNAWCTFMRIKMREAEGEHIEPNWIYESADKLNEAALPEEVRTKCRAHFESCDLCRSLCEHCKGLSVEIRHAGAEYPQAFDEVIKKVIEGLK